MGPIHFPKPGQKHFPGLTITAGAGNLHPTQRHMLNPTLAKCLMQWRLTDASNYCQSHGTSNLPFSTWKIYDNSSFLIMRSYSERFPTGEARTHNQMSEKILAESSFDLPTSGLWAQHAPTAPLCSPANVSGKLPSVSRVAPNIAYAIISYIARKCKKSHGESWINFRPMIVQRPR